MSKEGVKVSPFNPMGEKKRDGQGEKGGKRLLILWTTPYGKGSQSWKKSGKKGGKRGRTKGGRSDYFLLIVGSREGRKRKREREDFWSESRKGRRRQTWVSIASFLAGFKGKKGGRKNAPSQGRGTAPGKFSLALSSVPGHVGRCQLVNMERGGKKGKANKGHFTSYPSETVQKRKGKKKTSYPP